MPFGRQFYNRNRYASAQGPWQIAGPQRNSAYTPSPEMIIAAQRNPQLRDLISLRMKMQKQAMMQQPMQQASGGQGGFAQRARWGMQNAAPTSNMSGLMNSVQGFGQEDYTGVNGGKSFEVENSIQQSNVQG